jgi:FtsP/CotA-like multicopper oxidase with cupredoxin domain
VEARPGDTLIINVTNALPDEPIALHWHGLHVASKHLPLSDLD